MKVLFVSGIIMVNLLISTKYGIHCIWEQMWKMNKFMDSAADVKSCKSHSFRTPNSRYRLFIGVLMFLNCRILKILFCVIISGCMYFLVVFT